MERADQGKDDSKQGLEVLRDADNDIGDAMYEPGLCRGCRPQFHETYPCVDELCGILYTEFAISDAHKMTYGNTYVDGLHIPWETPAISFNLLFIKMTGLAVFYYTTRLQIYG